MSVRLDHGEDSLAELHEINVTPFIDVMLVLLIIFMVAAPLATVDIAVNLPASTAEPQPRPDKPVFLTVKADLTLALGEITVARETLGSALASATKGDKDTRIFLRADRSVPYGEMMEVMNLMRKAGYLKVALVGLETPPVPCGDSSPTPAASCRAGSSAALWWCWHMAPSQRRSCIGTPSTMWPTRPRHSWSTSPRCRC